MKILRLPGLALTLASPGAAAAQDGWPPASSQSGPQWREDVAGSRQSAIGPAPARAWGPVQVAAAVEATAASDGDVVRTAGGVRGDTFVILSPEVNLAHRSSERHLEIAARWAAYRFARLGAQNREAYLLSAEYGFRAGHDVTLSARASYRQAFEPRDSATAAEPASGPARFNSLRGEIGVGATSGPLKAVAALSLERRDYAPVPDANLQPVDQSFRDSRVVTAAASAEWTTPSSFTPVISASYAWTDSLHPLPCCDRTGTAARIEAGLRIAATPLITVEAAGGYAERRFRSPVFPDYSGFTGHLRAEWYATPLISLVAEGRRSLESPGLRDTAGALVDSAEARLYYEVRRQLDAVVSLARAHEAYRGTGIAADVWRAGLTLTYTATRHHRASAYLRYRDRTANSARLAGLGEAVEAGLSLRTAL